MNFKEFNKWKTDMCTPPQVNEAGDIVNDRNIKFELSYTKSVDETSNETHPKEIKTPIIAITLAEAIYRSIYTIQIEELPHDMEIASVDSDEKMASIKDRLISTLTFSSFRFDKITEDSVSFVKGDTIYTITCDKYKFNEVYDCTIEDDLIAVWEKPNNSDMICYVCYNMTNIAVNIKEVNKVTNLMQLSGLVKNNVFTHSNFLVSQFGFASITEEDIANNKYSNYLAKEVSYKRALIDKLELDKKIIVEQVLGLKHDFEILHGAIKRYYKMRKKITKRIHDLRKYVHDIILSHYNETKH